MQGTRVWLLSLVPCVGVFVCGEIALNEEARTFEISPSLSSPLLESCLPRLLLLNTYLLFSIGGET